jgi:hypothetical protein
MALAFFLVAAALATQEPVAIEPGDPVLESRCTEAVLDTFELLIVSPAQPPRRVATLVRTRGPIDDGRALRCLVVQRYHRDGGVDVDSSVLQTGTLAPERYAAVVGGQWQTFRFSRDSVWGAVGRPDSAPRTIAQAGPGPYFLAVADLEVLGALPLASGYYARFQGYNPGRGFQAVTAAVEGVDTLAVRGARQPAWRIRYDAGGAPTTLWVHVETHRLLRSRSALPNDAVFWRLLPGEAVPG